MFCINFESGWEVGKIKHYYYYYYRIPYSLGYSPSGTSKTARPNTNEQSENRTHGETGYLTHGSSNFPSLLWRQVFRVRITVVYKYTAWIITALIKGKRFCNAIRYHQPHSDPLVLSVPDWQSYAIRFSIQNALINVCSKPIISVSFPFTSFISFY